MAGGRVAEVQRAVEARAEEVAGRTVGAHRAVASAGPADLLLVVKAVPREAGALEVVVQVRREARPVIHTESTVSSALTRRTHTGRRPD